MQALHPFTHSLIHPFTIMLAVIFEVWPAEGRAAEYFDLGAALKADV